MTVRSAPVSDATHNRLALGTINSTRYALVPAAARVGEINLDCRIAQISRNRQFSAHIGRISFASSTGGPAALSADSAAHTSSELRSMDCVLSPPCHDAVGAPWGGEHEMRWDVYGKTATEELVRPCRSTPELLAVLGGHVRF